MSATEGTQLRILRVLIYIAKKLDEANFGRLPEPIKENPDTP